MSRIKALAAFFSLTFALFAITASPALGATCNARGDVSGFSCPTATGDVCGTPPNLSCPTWGTEPTCTSGKVFNCFTCDCRCPSGQIECSGACQAPAGGSCAPGQTLDPCTGACSGTAYALMSPATNTGSITFSGNASAGTVTSNGLVVDSANANGGALSSSSSILFGGSGSGEGIASNRTGGANQYGLDFYTNGGTKRVSITNGGNVGIGTAAPNNKLQVAGYLNFGPTYSNTFLGLGAPDAEPAAYYNVGVGAYADTGITTGGYNTAVGAMANRNLTSGSYNTGVGYAANYSNGTSSYNTGVGRASLYSSTGSGNTGLGFSSGYYITTGGNNTVVGQYSGYGISTGTGNTLIGYWGGGSSGPGAGNYNASLGYGANVASGVSYAAAIGYGATASANYAIVLGGSSSSVGIGTSVPAARLHVAGGGEIIGTNGSSANTRTLTILADGQSQINHGPYPGAWTAALQIQNNDNTRLLWLSPLDNASGGNARVRSAATGLDIYTGGTTVDSGTLGFSQDTSGNVGIGTTAPAQKLQVVGGGYYGLGVVCGNSQCFNFHNNGWIYTGGTTGGPYGGVGIAADKFYAAGDIFLGTRGTWLSSWLNQNVTTGAYPTFGSVYTSDWFRSYNATGWYNQSYGGGIWMQNSSDVEVYGGKNFRVPSGDVYVGAAGRGVWLTDEQSPYTAWQLHSHYDRLRTWNGSVEKTYVAQGDNFDAGNLNVGGVIPCIQGTCPPNYAVRLTPNLHLNSGAGYAVIVNWDNGTTNPYSQTFRIGNGAGSDVFYVRADGYTRVVGQMLVSGTTTFGNDVWVAQHTLNADVGFNSTYGSGSAQYFIAGNGLSNCSGWFVGYSFRNDGCYDTGMFSPGDGRLWFYTNGSLRLQYTMAGAFAYGSDNILSDARLKENVEDYKDGLAVLKQIRPVSFQYNGLGRTTAGQKGYGVIAQEVERFMPYAVIKNPDELHPGDKETTDILAVDPSVFPLLAINAIKELDAITLKIGEDGTVTVSGDLLAEGNKWGSGSQWISCPENGSECSCPEGSYVTKIRNRGEEIFCNKL